MSPLLGSCRGTSDPQGSHNGDDMNDITESMIGGLSPHQKCHLVWLLLNQLDESSIEITVMGPDGRLSGQHHLGTYGCNGDDRRPGSRSVLELEILLESDGANDHSWLAKVLSP